jgi:hypothetical protein
MPRVRGHTTTRHVLRPQTVARTLPARAEGHVPSTLSFARLHTRSVALEGSERLLTPREEARVRDVFDRAGAQTVAVLEKLLVSLEQPTARALLLRAVSARAEMLVDASQSEFALGVISAFAKRMRGMSTESLLAHATVLDLDPTKNSSRFDPLHLWNTQGTIRDPRKPDARSDNDGIFQRFTGSCGPTTLQMMLAEADPVTAFAWHDGLTSDSTSDAVAEFQKAILMLHGGGKALGRTESLLRSRIHNALAKLQIDARPLDDFLFKGGVRTKVAERALKALRDAYGFPSEADVDRLRTNPLPQSDDGVDSDALLKVLHDEVTPFIGVRYRATDIFGRGTVKKHLDEVARVLRKGFDVPFGIAEPPHWALLTAVKGKKPEREFLVSDPDSGRTVWVHERDFVRGKFVEQQLDIARPGDKPYVDMFLLPRD